MEDFEAIYAAKLPSFEGKVPWPYLDTHKPPLFTVGIGCAVGKPEALTLPFTVLAVPASQEQIFAHYDKVMAMMPGMHYSSYDYPGCLMLSDSAIMDLCGKRLSSFTASLRRRFPAFDSFPTPAKVGLMEMEYGLGDAGLGEYTLFLAAVSRKEWKYAAAQCARNGWDRAYDKRNQWCKLMFLEAAK